jgi:hypothetical protein
VVDQRQRGRLRKAHAIRHWERSGQTSDGVFGKPSALSEGKHAIAGRKRSYSGTGCVHDARHFGADGEWKRRLHLVFPLHLQNVEKIQAGRAIADAHLVRSGLGRRNLLERHRLRLAIGVHAPSFHGLQVLAFGPNSEGNIP